MNYLALFFAGAFLCNCMPHLAAGLRGELFPSPFAKPPGKGDSSPIVNFFWGLFNLLFGLCLLSRNPVDVGFNFEFLTLIAGALIIGSHLSLHFGMVQREKAEKQLRHPHQNPHDEDERAADDDLEGGGE
jgi:hypothetical protein